MRSPDDLLRPAPLTFSVRSGLSIDGQHGDATQEVAEDNAFRSTSIVNARIGYRCENGWSVHLDILNHLDTKAEEAEERRDGLTTVV